MILKENLGFSDQGAAGVEGESVLEIQEISPRNPFKKQLAIKERQEWTGGSSQYAAPLKHFAAALFTLKLFTSPFAFLILYIY